MHPRLAKCVGFSAVLHETRRETRSSHAQAQAIPKPVHSTPEQFRQVSHQVSKQAA